MKRSGCKTWKVNGRKACGCFNAKGKFRIVKCGTAAKRGKSRKSR